MPSAATDIEKITSRIYTWKDVGVLSIEGAAAGEFLQGYLTCDTARLQSDATVPAAICNVKGRVVANGWAISASSGVDLLLHQSLIETAATFLKPYVTFSKCTMATKAGRVQLTTAASGKAILPEIGIDLVPYEPNTIIRDGSHIMRRQLQAARYCLVTAATSGMFLPQMLGLEKFGAVDFAKGCYLGQEIVARAQFRGAVKRHVDEFSWQGEPPELGTSLTSGGVVVWVAQDIDTDFTQIQSGTGLAVI
jgi:folate-binding protein YgfZ